MNWSSFQQCVTFNIVYFYQGDHVRWLIDRVVYLVKIAVYDDPIDQELLKIEVEVSEK